MDSVLIASSRLKAEIAGLGAELTRLVDDAGRNYLWSGDPQWWSGRAPLLFPMVGRAAGDRIVVDGVQYPLAQHGFARRSHFDAVETTPDRCVMRLADSDKTRAAYPFPFRLDVTYEIAETTLSVTASVFNTGARPLPCSFGFHPAFAWPLPGAHGVHEIVFDHPEPAPIRRLDAGLMEARAYPNPLASGRLAPDASLFAHDALIFDELVSRRVAFGQRGGPKVAVAFPDMPHFGLWQKPGAPFLCLEPWQGYAAPMGYDGEFADRPGVVSIAPGARRDFAIAIEVTPAG